MGSLLASADAGCSDDEDFRFTGDFNGRRDCEWLGEKSSRQDKYCNQRRSYNWSSYSKGSSKGKGSNTKKIKRYCKKACRFCDASPDDYDDDAAPSMAPSTTSVPSAMPSEYIEKKKCKDFKSFRFETEFKGVKGCNWLSEKVKRQYKYCETRGWDGDADKKVKYGCRKSCANFLEGDQFDKCDRFEDDDYVEQVRAPYDDKDDDDVLDNCKDEMYFKFKTEHSGRRKCKWLSKKEDRKEKYCETRGWNDVGDRKVKFACRYSCGCFGTNP